MSRMAGLLWPGEAKKDLADFVLRVAEESGGNPCPPVILGVGVGGTAEFAMYLAKRALLRKVGERSADLEVAAFEEELLERVNATGIWGPRGGEAVPLPRL